MIRNTLAAVCLLGSLGLTPAPAPAAVPVLTWELVGVYFDDNTPVLGSFDYNGAGSCYTWNISVVAGIGLPDYTYTNNDPHGSSDCAGAHHHPGSVLFLGFPPGSQSRYLTLAFSSALTSAGGLIELVPHLGYECDNCSRLRPIVSGAVFAQAVPEPSTWAQLALGLVALVMSRRRPPGHAHSG